MELHKNRITQLTAPNGSGKSSIAMIIQEILFNKNVKGIKKSDILNRLKDFDINKEKSSNFDPRWDKLKKLKK